MTPERTPTLRFKRYEIECDANGKPLVLGRGGMGVTYRARDPKLECVVVLKVVGEAMQGDEAARARFRREARKLAQVRDHPHIATVFDFDEEDGLDFYVMELLDGEDLGARVRRVGPFSTRDALIILRQVASALTALWATSSVHRDIKPANIMALRDETHGLRVKLIDFGLAKDVGAADVTQVTKTGETGGLSVFYASPEQIQAKEVDIRSDIYSLGVTFWFLLTGKPPFAGASLWEVTNNHIHQPPPFELLPPHTPPAVTHLLAQMLAKDPADRPAEPTKIEAAAADILDMLPPDGAEHDLGSGPTTLIFSPSSATTKSFGATQPMPMELEPARASEALKVADALRSMSAQTTVAQKMRPARDFSPQLFLTSSQSVADREPRRPGLRTWILFSLGGLAIFLGSFFAFRWITADKKDVPPERGAPVSGAVATPVPLPVPGSLGATPPPAAPVSESEKTSTALAPTEAGTPAAAREAFTNSLEQRFLPVPGTKVLFSVFETRVIDFRTFANETKASPSRWRGMLVLDRVGWRARDGLDWRDPGFPQSDGHPVVGVNHDDAIAFCEWLTKRERASGAIRPSQRYRLPTDAEWSRAVGLPPEPGNTPRERDSKMKGEYPWGREWPPTKAYGNYRGAEAIIGREPENPERKVGPADGFPRTAPVGSFPANALGLHDVGGNVWEWCDDWYDGAHRTVRGAAWFEYDAAKMLSSYRDGAMPSLRKSDIGFRVVLTAPTDDAAPR